MNLLQWAIPVLCLGAMVLEVAPARAQNYPSRPVRIVLSNAGGSSDIAARMIVPALSASLGQPVIIDNRSGQLGIVTARGAAPDGHTLLSYGGGLWLVPLMSDKLQYDPVKDFAPITLQFRVPNILVVHPSLASNSVKELIALAKAKAGQMNVASGSPGSASHLAAEMFNLLTRVNITRIPFAGAPPAITALIAGEVQLMFASPSTIQAHIKSGRVRALATTGPEISPLAPGLPTVAATVPGFEAEALTAMFAPAGTPAAIITRLNQEFVRALNQPDIREKLFNTGLVVSTGTPEHLAAFIKADMARMGKVIKEAGIRE
jgi:tripartite-type tricarboxylate transporter receptor subunit TctC